MKTLKLIFLIIIFQIGFILNGYTEIIDYIVAIVDDEIIISSELQEKLVLITEHYNKIYTGEELNERVKQAKDNILNEAIEEKILMISAKKADIEVTEEEIEKNIEEFKKRFATSEEFYAELKKEGFTLNDLKERTEEKIRITKFIRLNILRDIRITEEEINNFYEENKNEFLIPGQVKISQILIKSSGNSEELTKTEEILQKLKSGEDFASLARLYSQGPNASAGGNLGFIHPEQLHPKIRQIISELEVGEFTNPIKTSAGYHIMKLEARKLSQYSPISEVKDSIRGKIYDLKTEKAYREWMENAKKDIEIVTYTSF